MAKRWFRRQAEKSGRAEVVRGREELSSRATLQDVIRMYGLMGVIFNSLRERERQRLAVDAGRLRKIQIGAGAPTIEFARDALLSLGVAVRSGEGVDSLRVRKGSDLVVVPTSKMLERLIGEKEATKIAIEAAAKQLIESGKLNPGQNLTYLEFFRLQGQSTPAELARRAQIIAGLLEERFGKNGATGKARR
ncbi:hypothetical protein HYS54_02055 [Candidatus Micrarchaeota archaeon]|nr:hypothetical protein [Candidatus Micrarchaeota archaeon]